MAANTIGLACDGAWPTVLDGPYRSGNFGRRPAICETDGEYVATLIGPSKEAVRAAAEAAGWWVEMDSGRAQCPACRAAGPCPAAETTGTGA